MDIFHKELTLIVLYQRCNEMNIRKSYLPCKNEKITTHMQLNKLDTLLRQWNPSMNKLDNIQTSLLRSHVFHVIS